MAGLFSFFKKKSHTTDLQPQQQETTFSRDEAEKFVTRLDEFDYFKYAALEDVPALRKI